MRIAANFNSDEMQDIINVLNTIYPEHPVEWSYVQRKQQQFGTQAWNELLRESLSLHFSVVSFSLKPDIPLLWSHYADSGAGVVIGYSTSVLNKIRTGLERLAAVQYYPKPLFDFGYGLFQCEFPLHEALVTKGDHRKYECQAPWVCTRFCERPRVMASGTGGR